MSLLVLPTSLLCGEASVTKAISELGEKKVIELILDCLDVMPEIAVSFGDDVSAVSLEKDRLVVVKTDMLVGKTDVPSGMSLRQAARKAVVMNVSDFASKGVKPLVVLSSLGLPRSMTEADVKQIGLGLNDAAREYGAYVIGGDTNEACDLIISCSLLGFSDKKTLVRRSGARAGDIVAVTGHFGKTAAGLKILLEGLPASRTIWKALTDSVHTPKARLKEGLALAQTGALTSSIDSSDGLAWSLHELSEASNVGFTIDNVAVAEEATEFAREHALNPFDLALYGGEEYELVMTVNPNNWEKAREAVEELGTALTRIGRVTLERRIMLETNGGTRPIHRRGWEHFRN